MTNEEIKKYKECVKHYVLPRQYGKTPCIDMSVKKFIEILDYIDNLQQENEKQKELLEQFNAGNFDILKLLKILDMLKPYMKFEINIPRHPELSNISTSSILNVNARLAVCGEEEKILKEWGVND